MYVHYKSLDSAVLAYESINGRYFAGKQVQCEFVSVTRWRVAICGEFMRSKVKTCSRGTACNFIHCFRNPGGDYEWADWDKPPPRYWVQNMVALFGYSDDSASDKHVERESSRSARNSTRISAIDTDRYHSQRSQSRDTEYSRSSITPSEDDSRSSYPSRHHRHVDRKNADVLAVNHRDNRSSSEAKQHRDNTSTNDSDRNPSDWDKTTDSPRKRSGVHGNRRLDLEPPPAEISIHKAIPGTFGKGRQHRKISKSPDDTDSCTYEEKYLRTEDFEETKHEKSKPNHSSTDRDAGYASRDRSYRSYSSKSRKDVGKYEDEDSRRKYKKKSKRKREVEIESDSDSRVHYHGRKERLREVDEDRGRWEPD